MAEIINFPKGVQRRAAEHARQSRAERAERLEEVLRRNSGMTAADQVAVAENLWAILERAKQAGVARAVVMRAAHIGSAGDSTKHITQYVRNPDWPEDRKKARKD
jgi:LDH2 family malate/lactate/ureidoglycolate dehydrogenase